MKFIALICCALIILVGCRNQPPTTTLYLTGEADLVDAKVYLDDTRLIGMMVKEIVTGPDYGILKPGDIFTVGVDIGFINGTRKPSFSGTTSIINVPNGVHRITIVTVSGKRYTTLVNFTGGEMYGGPDTGTNQLKIG